MSEVAKGPGWELRRGRWQDVLGDAVDNWNGRCFLPAVGEVDAIITDPPYTKRNIAGFRSGHKYRKGIDSEPSGGGGRYVIPYDAIDEPNVKELVEWTAEHVRWWFLAFNDHIGFGWFEAALEKLGWFNFAPVLWTKPNPPPRQAGDGPCCAAEHIAIGRPRRRLEKRRRGSRPGWYSEKVIPGNALDFRLVGAKPLHLMERLILDYTLPGDLIVDPYAGSGTTLLAAAKQGRRAIGCEADPATFEVARARLEKGFTPALFLEERKATQEGLFDETES